MGVSAGIIGLATAGGPFVGGAVAQGLAWQWLFWVNVPVGLLVIAGVLLKMSGSRGPQARLDLVGVLLTTGGVFGLVWALVRGNDVGWLSAQTLGALAAGLVLTVGFVLWERRASAPMVPMGFFTQRAFSAGNAASFTMTASMYAQLYFLAQYFQSARHYGPFGAGLRIMPFTATLLVFGPLSGRLADRLGERRLVAGGLTLQALGLAAIGGLAGHHAAYPAMVPALIVSGAGVSTAIPPTQKAVVSAVRPYQIGQASGVFSMLRQFGALFGTAVSVAVFAASGGYVTAQSFTDGFTAAMQTAAGLAAVGAVAGLMLPRLRGLGAATAAGGSTGGGDREAGVGLAVSGAPESGIAAEAVAAH